METFGRGCLYIIIGIGVLFLFAVITQSYINIPIFIAIPLIIIAFWAASKKTNQNGGDAGGYGDHTGTSNEQDNDE